MTGPWDDELTALRTLYLRESGARIDDLDRVLDRLERDGSDARALQDLRRGFHGFAGSGTTYGVPAVTALGLEGERRCSAAGSGPVVATDVKGWREDLAALRREILAAAQGGAAALGEAGRDVERPLPSVLVIQEEGADREALVRALGQESFTVRAAAGLDPAGGVRGGRLPDAVVVDAAGDQAAAFALVERLRAQPGGDRPVVFVVGGHGGVLDRVEAIHCGADAGCASCSTARTRSRRASSPSRTTPSRRHSCAPCSPRPATSCGWSTIRRAWNRSWPASVPTSC